MMKRRYILSLLAILTVAVVARLAVAFWPASTPVLASAKKMTSMVAEAQESGTAAGMQNQATASSAPNSADGGQIRKRPAGKPSSGVIPEAEASVFPGIPGDNMTPQEIEVLKSLQKIKKKLDARAKKLDSRQKAAEEAEARAKKRIDQLEKLEVNIQDLLQQEKTIRDKKIKRLAAVYDGMKAQKAAPVVAKLDLATVVRVFSNMSEKQVGKILAYLPPDEAVKISRALTERIGSLNQ